MNTMIFRVGPLAAALLLAGCAGFSADGGFGPVDGMTRERTGQSPVLTRPGDDGERQRTRTAELLAAPLTADGAVELAFLHNRGLQARFAELRIAEADLVRAGRLPNPAFSFGRLRHGDGTTEIDRGVTFDVLGLLTMPLAVGVEQRRLAQVQLDAADEAVSLAARTRRAWVRAVAAQELQRYHARVKDTADAAGELAGRMRQAGNFSALAQMREQSFAADATARAARASHDAVAERERLVRLLGLPGDTTFILPDRLPDLPAEPASIQGAEQSAMDKRLDVQRATRGTETLAKSLGLTKATRFVNVLEIGYQNQSDSGQPRANGYVVELELPIFDGGGTRLARAEATYQQALHHTADVALRARSEVREAHAAYQTAWTLARHYRDDVVPLKKRIAAENLLRYNGMLISVFDLLADARSQVEGATGYVESLRDFWLADTDLRTATTGGSPTP